MGEETFEADNGVRYRYMVGLGARALFYPTLLYNVIRNKVQPEFRWWDEVDQFLLLGAVPFPKDVPRLKKLGVGGVVTLNEPYETLVPASLYKDHGINHLVIPTRDYLFAPSYANICQAVEFIHCNASCGMTTYVHCKAGRGRSTTIVLCYLMEYKHMTPDIALAYVRSTRPRVLLAGSQWQAVQEYGMRRQRPPLVISPSGMVSRDDPAESSIVLITEEDLEGYGSYEGTLPKALKTLRTACKVQIAAARSVLRFFRASAELRKLSCLLLAETKLLTVRPGTCASLKTPEPITPETALHSETRLDIVVQ